MTAIWTCEVGHLDVARDALPPGCDSPMRDAVVAAFKEITGREDQFLFSGWGTVALTESRQAVVERRMPDHTADEWSEACAIVDDIVGDAELDLTDFTHDAEVAGNARSALVELLAHVRRSREATTSSPPPESTPQ